LKMSSSLWQAGSIVKHMHSGIGRVRNNPTLSRSCLQYAQILYTFTHACSSSSRWESQHDASSRSLSHATCTTNVICTSAIHHYMFRSEFSLQVGVRAQKQKAYTMLDDQHKILIVRFLNLAENFSSGEGHVSNFP